MDKENYPGKVIHNSASVTRQGSEATKQAKRAMEQVKRTIVNRQKEIVVLLYKFLVRSHAEYHGQSWTPYMKKDKTTLKKKKKAQRRSAY